MVTELTQSTITIRNLYTTEDSFEKGDFDQKIITQKELERISSLKNPNQVLALAEMPDQLPVDWTENLILVLDSIRDPGNMGTIIRTAKWFGVNTIICSEDCADAYNPKTVQSTMGALFHIKLLYQDLGNFIDNASQKGFDIISATMTGKSLYEFRSEAKKVVILGSESHGVSAGLLEKSNVRITIPNGESVQKVESLNAAIANALILSELTRNNS